MIPTVTSETRTTVFFYIFLHKFESVNSAFDLFYNSEWHSGQKEGYHK